MLKAQLLTVPAIAVFAAMASASAQDENCIENIAGNVVCGAAADAVRARIRAEGAYNAAGEDASASDMRNRRTRSGSAYSSFGNSAFVRGGYSFAAHGGGASGPMDGFLLSAGYRSAIQRSSGSQFSLETELIYTRDSEMIFGGEATAAALTGLASLRWDVMPGAMLSPFVSAGVGPAHYWVKFDDGVTSVSDGSLALGYSGRAGVEAQVADNFSLEAAYRYLGAKTFGEFSGVLGVHSAEIGLNYNF